MTYYNIRSMLNKKTNEEIGQPCLLLLSMSKHGCSENISVYITALHNKKHNKLKTCVCVVLKCSHAELKSNTNGPYVCVVLQVYQTVQVKTPTEIPNPKRELRARTNTDNHFKRDNSGHFSSRGLRALSEGSTPRWWKHL